KRIEQRGVGGEGREEIEEDVGELARRREQKAVVAVADALAEADAVVERAHRPPRPEKIGHLHRNVEAGRRAVETKPEVGAADDLRRILRLEPAPPQLN